MKRPKFVENVLHSVEDAQTFRHMPGFSDLPVMTKVVPAHSTWPYIPVLPNYCYPGHMNYEGSIQSIVFQDGPQPTVWGADNNGRAGQVLLATS